MQPSIIRTMDQQSDDMSNEKKHTPGEWAVDGMTIFAPADGIAAKDVAVILHDGNSSIQEREANARLIAAAPELLEALEAAEVLWNAIHQSNYSQETREAIWDQWDAKRQVALAKATGAAK